MLSSAPGGRPATGGHTFLGLWLIALFSAALLGGALVVRRSAGLQ